MNVRIRQMGKKAATAGYHFDSTNDAARKLEPGEVVHVPEDSKYRAIFEKMLDRMDSPLEITRMPATRPLVFDKAREARLSSPSRKLIHKTDIQEREEVLGKYRRRFAEQGRDEPEVRASKAAQSLADDLGVDLRKVQGTGHEGRITIEDVRGAA